MSWSPRSICRRSAGVPASITSSRASPATLLSSAWRSFGMDEGRVRAVIGACGPAAAVASRSRRGT